MSEKSKILCRLKKECLSCKLCSIGGQNIKGNLSNVFSNMCMKAKIVVLGQNPGYNEVILKTPFVGISGKFFDKAIKDVLGCDRSSFYITNSVHCYTPENRKPTREETKNCQYYVDTEINTIKPNLIITLGGPSLEQITGRKGITKIHGNIVSSIRYNIPVLPLFHPSPLNMNKKGMKECFYNDMKKIKEYL